MIGKDCLQGSHHEAQKSISTTLPLVESGSFPSNLKSARFGNASPVFIFIPSLATRLTAESVNAKERTSGSHLPTGRKRGFSRSCVCIKAFCLESIFFGGDAALGAGTNADEI